MSAEPNIRGISHLGVKRRQPAKAGADSSCTTDQPRQQHQHQQTVYIGPQQCLFDDTVFEDVPRNVEYMQKKYSLFIPNAEYLTNLDGLIGFLGEKVNTSRQCLFCDRQFASAEAVRMHMLSKGHTLIGTESEEMRAEIEDFYDFSSSYKQLAKALSSKRPAAVRGVCLEDNPHQRPEQSADLCSAGECVGSEDEWEYFDYLDGEEQPADAKLGVLLSKFGCKRTHVTAVGDLELPGGRAVGHRNLAYVYKQRLRPHTEDTHRSRALKNEAENKNDEVVVTDVQKAQIVRYHRRFLSNQMKLGVKQNSLQKYIKKKEMFFM
eukprot:GHVS01029038.1.p1 GENE.GHVS01029038.1~~GHVS01029038.1.p1  ORF type:complete len:356 (+),score=60.14 GHVS01029038.1:106-1068(+)